MIIDRPLRLPVSPSRIQERVWWLANASTGLYYHLPLAFPQITASPDLPLPKESPDLVILSKPGYL